MAEKIDVTIRIEKSDESRMDEIVDALKAVAEEVGYGSEFAFSDAFKRRHGLSPGRWRHQQRIGVRP